MSKRERSTSPCNSILKKRSVIIPLEKDLEDLKDAIATLDILACKFELCSWKIASVTERLSRHAQSGFTGALAGRVREEACTVNDFALDAKHCAHRMESIISGVVANESVPE